MNEPDTFEGHDAGVWAPMPTREVASWPKGAFAENLAVDESGAVFVTLHTDQRIDRYDPADGSVSTVARFPTPIAGVALANDGTLWVSGGTLGVAPGTIYRVSPDGAVDAWCSIEDAVFLNGCTIAFDGGTLLICESMTARVLAVDLATRGRWRTWLADERLKPNSAQVPGANGIKFQGGFAYVSVTDANLMVRAPVSADGSPGPLEIVYDRLRADDFAFAASGALYVATHPAQSVIRVGTDGTRTTIAGPPQTAGATACAFGRGADAHALYVTTTGGLYSPWRGESFDAKLLRIEVGEAA